MRSRRLLFPFTLVVPAVVFGVVGLVPVASADPTPLASTGYAEEGTPVRVVARDAHALRTLGVDGVDVRAHGASSVDPPDAGLTTLLAAAHASGLRAELLVSNYSNRLGDFDPAIGARLLRDPAHVAALATQLAAYVAAQGWDGVQLDLESLSGADAAGLTALAGQLQADMAPEKSVSIAVMASARLGQYAHRGYQLAALGAVVDTMTLMTYDQHGPGWSGPGPIGARPWQRHCLRAALTQVPAAKLDLGVAGYGYTWPPHGAGRAVTDDQARQLVARDGARAVWHAGAGEWSAHLSDGTVLWWSDRRSYRLRVAMAEHAGLHGLSIWRLGSIDPLPS